MNIEAPGRLMAAREALLAGLALVLTACASSTVADKDAGPVAASPPAAGAGAESPVEMPPPPPPAAAASADSELDETDLLLEELDATRRALDEERHALEVERRAVQDQAAELRAIQSELARARNGGRASRDLQTSAEPGALLRLVEPDEQSVDGAAAVRLERSADSIPVSSISVDELHDIVMIDETRTLGPADNGGRDASVNGDETGNGDSSDPTGSGLFAGEISPLVDAESTEPEIVTVFYGTNRQRLEPAFSRYLTPFVKPLLCLALLFLLPRMIRAVIRRRLHKVAINLMLVVVVVTLVYLSFASYQTFAQRLQADRTLPVQYGPGRLQQDVDGLPYELGVCRISIPPTHQTGRVELPDLLHFEFRSDPMKHFVLAAVTPQPSDEFFTALRARVASSPDRDMFVFVHGFHNTFQDAAFRTAQIAHDLEFPGAPVFFSWPSQGKVLDYTTDENNVRVAVAHLKRFLEQLKAESKAERIHVIAHSMGSRALAAAVMQIGLQSDGDRVFNEMILAAPDMDADEFRNIAKDLTSVTDRVTLYASSKDQALTASRKVHGGTHPRAGESLPVPVTALPVETIDVSYVTGGHSYISNSGRILKDLNDILVNSRPLDEAIAERVRIDNENHYWILR